MLLRDRSGRADDIAVNEDSADRGVGAAELFTELMEVIVFERLTFALLGVLDGIGGGGMALSVVSLAMLCNIVAPRCRLVVFGLCWVGVTVLLLKAVDALVVSGREAGVATWNPRTEQMFFASVMQLKA